MHQYSGVKKGYRPARTSRGYRSLCPNLEQISSPLTSYIHTRYTRKIPGILPILPILPPRRHSDSL